MSTPRFISAVLALSGLLACSEDNDGLFGERVWIGEHLEVWATSEASICPESFEALDAHAEAVSLWAVEHGVQPNSKRWRYYWLDEETFETSGHCRDGAAACIMGGEIVAQGMVEHESVHAELPAMTGLFFEGLAGLLGGYVLDRDAVVSASEPVDIRAILDRGIMHSEYSGAEGFTRILLDRYPDEAVPAMAATAGVRGYENVRDVMQEYGVDLDAALAEYTGQCRNSGLRFPILECVQPVEPWRTGDLWQADGRLDCASPGNVGPTGLGITTVRSFDIEAYGFYTIRISGLNGFLGGCGVEACAPIQPDGGLADVGGVILTSTTVVELDAGRYWVRLFATEDNPDPSWTLQIERGDTTPLGCPRACVAERDACVETAEDPFECEEAMSQCLEACP
jgi:hypothetical protein